MKIFNNFSELAQSKVLTGTPVRILKPALVDGMVEASGEGLSLLSGNVFVGQFVDQESVTARKTSLLDDAFTGGISAYINRYEKNNDGNWIASADGRTSAVFYGGQLWWPLVEIPYTANGYLITSWGLPTGNPDILEVSTSAGTVFQFNRFTGLVDGGTSGGSIVSETPPDNPLAGNRWTRCSDMKSFIWYVDSEGSQWIEDNPSMGASRKEQRIPTTVDIVATGNYGVGDYLELTDRANAKAEVKGADWPQTINGYDVLNAGDGKVAVITLESEINAKWFGVNGGSDDTSALQYCIDYAFSNLKSVFIPSGIYNFTSLTIKCPQQAGYYDRPRLVLRGEGIGNTVLQHIGTGTAVNLVGELDTTSSAYGAVIELLSIKKSVTSATTTTNGIKLQKGTGYILNNMSIEGGINGIYMPDDIWLSKFTNIKISGRPSYGINMSASGTSNYFDQLYVTYSTVSAYKLGGNYSHIGALAADNCSGSYIYEFNYFSGGVGSLGCEGANVDIILNGSHSQLSIGHLNIYNPTITTTAGLPINCNSSDVSIATTRISSAIGAVTIAQKLYSQLDSKVVLGSVESDWTFTSVWGNSSDVNGFAIISNGNAPVGLRQAGSRAYLGLDRKAMGKDTIDDGNVHSVAIFLDAVGSPRYTSDGVDRRYQVGAKQGDWFIESTPASNNCAAYVATSESSDLSSVGAKKIPLVLVGTTAQRPTIGLWDGLEYKDSTLKKTVTRYGTSWYDETGTVV